MRKSLNKKNIIPVAVLMAICIVVAVVLGVVNAFTKDAIYNNANQSVYDSLRVVIDGDFQPIDKPEGAPQSVNNVYRVTEGGELVGHAVTLSVQGYASVISITVGVDKNGNVTNAVVTAQAESHGKPGMESYTDNFTGASKEEIEKTDVFAGATVSSTAIKKAVLDAVNTVMGTFSEETAAEELPREESEVIYFANALVGAEIDLVNVTPVKLTNVKRVYKAGGDGYVFYAVVMSRYGYPETETLVYVGNDGKIRNVNKLVWKTSDAEYGYVPPGEDTVNEFYNKLIGKSLSDIASFKSSELISNATNTSTNLKNAIIEGLEAVEALNSPETSYAARIVGIIILTLSVLGVAAYKFVPVVIKRRKTDEQ